MPEIEGGIEPWGSGRGPGILRTCSKKAIEIGKKQLQKIPRTPHYTPANPDWNIAFRALGLDYQIVKRFWKIFCKANTSCDGQLCLLEFLTFFNLERTSYVEKTFGYFDTTGGGEIDFLEFVVSAWNVCSLDPHTLTHFTFDMYDVDSDGLLSCPEIETMVRELYGQYGMQSSLGTECRDALMALAEENGAITLDLFASFSLNHSMLLFPIYQIQRKLQSKVLGLRFWKSLYRRIKRLNKKTKGKEKYWLKRKLNKFDRNMLLYKPRDVLVHLRSYKRERGTFGLTSEEEDLYQCKNLREFVEKHDKYWHDKDWDKEKPHPLLVVCRRLYKLLSYLSKKTKPSSVSPVVPPQEKPSTGDDTTQNALPVSDDSIPLNQSLIRPSVRIVELDETIQRVRTLDARRATQRRPKSRGRPKTAIGYRSSTHTDVPKADIDTKRPTTADASNFPHLSKVEFMSGPPVVMKAPPVATNGLLMKGPPVTHQSMPRLSSAAKGATRRPTSRKTKRTKPREKDHPLYARPRTPGSLFFPSEHGKNGGSQVQL
mmetsp:Transcript_13173/g.20039  ORF Transcript_13173/g.20039 Transcript_13173/m.20039 type:complete len:542 (+) Transcript_13173:41-1666(+)|eukprot:CAMPEP_0196820480 /NCGR_PEP_ID=MMETSP1362-20130617/75500_1 /TAXON_ID=163516 /ORGANISM="Leptocylindrus danicus, Strain CCMP1856" /LENGTH=541 /DNA_ID=CAMNT_0042199385 /DNA_START=36 /DNA_END=1661 /DNA_ORIENTATION=+